MKVRQDGAGKWKPFNWEYYYSLGRKYPDEPYMDPVRRSVNRRMFKLLDGQTKVV